MTKEGDSVTLTIRELTELWFAGQNSASYGMNNWTIDFIDFFKRNGIIITTQDIWPEKP
jgi:hypothetical protein